MAPNSGTNPKPRMGVLFRQSTSMEKSQNLSPELDALQQKYKDQLCPQLKNLRNALKQRHTALVQTAKAQASVADALSAMSHDTPYADSTAESTQAMRSASQTTSERRAVEFQTRILDHLDAWQSSVSTRVNQSTKQTDALRREVDHYSNKLDSLQNANQKKAAKNNSNEIDPQDAEKMERNQQKYQQSKEIYEKAAEKHYATLDEVVNQSWKELHPILNHLLELDAELVKDSNSKGVLAKYESTLEALEQQVQKQQEKLQKDQNTPPQSQPNRFHSISNDSPQQLNSKYDDGLNTTPPTNRSAAPPSSGSPPSNGGKKVTKTVTTVGSDGRKVTQTVTTTNTASPSSPQSPPKKRFWGNNNNNNGDNKAQPPETALNNNNNGNAVPGNPRPDSQNEKRKPLVSVPWRNNNNNNDYGKSTAPPASPASVASPSNNQNRNPPSRNFNKPTGRAAAPPTSGTGSPRRSDIGPRPPRPAAGKGAKVASTQKQQPLHPHDHDPWEGADPSRWRLLEQKFSGSFIYETKGEAEHVIAPVKKGQEIFRANPDKYLYLFYQSNMVDFPTNQQRYTLIHREGSKGHKPTGVGPRGPMTIFTQYYERLPAFPNNELPSQHRDRYTDSMTHQRRKLHSAKNKPIMPGRGMGVCDTPNLKIIGDVDPSDIHQGSVGDCWLLSGISSLAEFDGAIKHLYRKTTNLEQRPFDGPNQYIITLWDLETWTEKDIVVDERLPVMADGSGKLLASRPSEDGELWVCYLEKALAIHCGGWDKITGGQCTHAWALMTGCKEQYTIRFNPETGKYACFGKYDTNNRRWSRHANSPHDGEQNLWRNAWPEVGGGGGPSVELTQEELFMKMCAWDDVNFIVGAGCSDSKKDAGLVGDHAYSVIECHNDVAGTPIDLIKVRNPWGKGEIENGEFDDDGPGWDKWPQVKRALNPVVADDGIFWVTKDEFFQFFSTIYLSASNMTEFLED